MSDIEWVDDCFTIKEKKWGTWDSFDREGKCIITSLTKQECINATRFYLKGKQEGWKETKTYSGEIAGKL
jgi:hypothetical protein